MDNGDMLDIIRNKISVFDKDSCIEENRLTTFLNPYSYLVVRSTQELMDEFDVVFIDGEWLCKLVRFFRIAPSCQRISFDMTSLAPAVFRQAQGSGKSIYFIGSKEDEVRDFVRTIESEFPGLEIRGYRSGYFDDMSEVVKDVAGIAPDVVVAGLGTPLQEEFLLELRRAGWGGAGFTCGGFFHQTARKGIRYYPEFFDRHNLRWLYRIIDEPKLLRRYLGKYPLFLVVFLYDYLLFQVKKRKHAEVANR